MKTTTRSPKLVSQSIPVWSSTKNKRSLSLHLIFSLWKNPWQSSKSFWELDSNEVHVLHHVHNGRRMVHSGRGSVAALGLTVVPRQKRDGGEDRERPKQRDGVHDTTIPRVVAKTRTLLSSGPGVFHYLPSHPAIHHRVLCVRLHYISQPGTKCFFQASATCKMNTNRLGSILRAWPPYPIENRQVNQNFA